MAAAVAALTQAHQTYLTQVELAVYLRVAERTLERWRVEGAGPPHIKAGRRCLYGMTDVEHWLASRRRRSTSEILEG